MLKYAKILHIFNISGINGQKDEVVNRTMRIIISLGNEQDSKKIFETMQVIVKTKRIKSEITWSLNHDAIRKQLKEDAFYYDIFILNALDDECMKTAVFMRKRNLTSTLILLTKNIPNIHKIMVLRPSFLLTGEDDWKLLGNAITYAYNEWLHTYPFFTVKNKEVLIRVNYSDILWFESQQRIVTLHGKKKEISFYGKLMDVIPMLPKDQFIRCHQSFIVNADLVEQLDKTSRCLYMVTNDMIKISKSYYADVVAYIDARK